MADFTRRTNNNAVNDSPFESVTFGGDAPVMEAELNELQDLLNKKSSSIMEALGDFIYIPAEITVSISGDTIFSKVLEADADTCSVELLATMIFCGGYCLHVSGMQLEYIKAKDTYSSGLTSNHISLYIAKKTYTKDDTDIQQSGYDNTKCPYIQHIEASIDVSIYDDRIGQETTRRDGYVMWFDYEDNPLNNEYDYKFSRCGMIVNSSDPCKLELRSFANPVIHSKTITQMISMLKSNNIAIGLTASTSPATADNIAIGSMASITGNIGMNNIAIGTNAYIVGGAGHDNIAIGSNAKAYSTSNAIAIGSVVNATSVYSIAIGYNVKTYTSLNAIAIGKNVSCDNGGNSVAIGNNITASGSYSEVIIGHNVSATGNIGVAIGYNVTHGSGSKSIAIGYFANVSANKIYNYDSTNDAKYNVSSSMAIGDSVRAESYNSIAIGSGITVGACTILATALGHSISIRAAEVAYNVANVANNDYVLNASSPVVVAVGERINISNGSNGAVAIGGNITMNNAKGGLVIAPDIAYGFGWDPGSSRIVDSINSIAIGINNVIYGANTAAAFGKHIKIGANVTGSVYGSGRIEPVTRDNSSGYIFGQGSIIDTTDGEIYGHSSAINASNYAKVYGTGSIINSEGSLLVGGYSQTKIENSRTSILIHSNVGGMTSITNSTRSIGIIVGGKPTSIDNSASAIVIGANTNAVNSTGSVVICGNCNDSSYSTIIGYSPLAYNSPYSVILGRDSLYNCSNVLALSYDSRRLESIRNSVIINGMSNSNYTLAIGGGIGTGSNYSTVIGGGGSPYIVSAPNTIQLGGDSLSTLRCRISLSVTSDERDKKVIDNINNATKFLSKIDAVRYYDNNRNIYRYTEDDVEAGNITQEEYDDIVENRKVVSIYGYNKDEHEAGTKKGDRIRVGVLAQKVVDALLDVYGDASYGNIVNDDWYDFTDEKISSLPKGAENRLTITYDNFIPFLIKAIQELNNRIEELEKERGIS